tara:strand:+ start:26556 stop:27671 length:1116 start_codon:yes stop_codon:yes gene_type:complete
MDSGFSVKDWDEDEAEVSQDADAFAYFVDPAELAVLTPGWPSGMRLLLCMDAAGLCEFVVFHDDEENAVFERVADILDRPVGGFAVSPDLDGHPTRRLLFSEENALLKAIQDSDSLQEIAADYLINYNFAQEEGLDFDKLMRPRQSVEGGQALRVTTNKIFPVASRTARKKRMVRSGPPEGYASVDEVSPEDCFYLSLEMWVAGGRIRIAASSDQPLPMVPTLAREIAFRDDFSSVYIPRNILPGHWRPLDDLAIDMPIELFPAGFSDNAVRRKVQVAVMPRGIFVEFGAPLPATAPVDVTMPMGDAALPATVPSRRRQFLKNLHIPLIAIAGLGVTGLFSTIIAQTTAHEQSAQVEQKTAIYRMAPQVQP